MIALISKAQKLSLIMIGALVAGFGPAIAATAPVGPARTLLVVSMKHGAHSTDENIKRRLDDHAFAVMMVDQNDPAAQRIDGYHLIVISSTANAEKMSAVQADSYKNAAIPLVCCNARMLGRLSMTGTRSQTDWGVTERPSSFIYLVNGSHALQAGVPNGMVTPFTQPVANINYGKPGLASIIIATLPGEPEKATMFAFPGGGTMDYPFVAPARRVMLFLGDGHFDLLNEAGLDLFDSGMNWAIHRALKKRL